MEDHITPTRLLEEHAAECPQGLNSAQFAEMMDANDPLSSYRALYHYPKKSTLPSHDPKVCGEEEDALYYTGHSLGLCPKGADQLMLREMKK